VHGIGQVWAEIARSSDGVTRIDVRGVAEGHPGDRHVEFVGGGDR
jgi:hypothetical protein